MTSHHHCPVASYFGVVRPYDRGCKAADSIPVRSAEIVFFLLRFRGQEVLSFERCTLTSSQGRGCMRNIVCSSSKGHGHTHSPCMYLRLHQSTVSRIKSTAAIVINSLITCHHHDVIAVLYDHMIWPCHLDLSIRPTPSPHIFTASIKLYSGTIFSVYLVCLSNCKWWQMTSA